MAKKRSQIEQAIYSLQLDMDVLEMAMARLKQQQAAVTKKKPRAVKAPTIMGELMQAVKGRQGLVGVLCLLNMAV